MTYTIERHAELPAVIGTWSSDFVFGSDGKPFSQKIHAILEQQTSPIYYVLDLREWHSTAFMDLVEAANMATRGENANFHHEMNRGNLFITNDPGVQATAEGLHSEVFGSANTLIFSTLEDALDYIAKHS